MGCQTQCLHEKDTLCFHISVCLHVAGSPLGSLTMCRAQKRPELAILIWSDLCGNQSCNVFIRHHVQYTSLQQEASRREDQEMIIAPIPNSSHHIMYLYAIAACLPITSYG